MQRITFRHLVLQQLSCSFWEFAVRLEWYTRLKEVAYISCPCCAGHAIVRDTVVSDNGLEGVLVRDGASLEAASVKAIHNARHGFNLSNGSGVFRSCTSSANGAGAALIGDDFESKSARTQIASK